jgi:bifunctional DNase/RNase
MKRDRHSLVEMKVQKILLDKENNVSLVFLANVHDEKQVFPIVTGIGGTKNIVQIIKGASFFRPLTHDLLNTIITTLKGKVSHVIIDKLENDDVVATVHLTRQQKEICVESQASDAIAIALKAHSPIYAAKELLMMYSEIQEEINEINDREFNKWLNKLDASTTAEKQ